MTDAAAMGYTVGTAVAVGGACIAVGAFSQALFLHHFGVPLTLHAQPLDLLTIGVTHGLAFLVLGLALVVGLLAACWLLVSLAWAAETLVWYAVSLASGSRRAVLADTPAEYVIRRAAGEARPTLTRSARHYLTLLSAGRQLATRRHALMVLGIVMAVIAIADRRYEAIRLTSDCTPPAREVPTLTLWLRGLVAPRTAACAAPVAPDGVFSSVDDALGAALATIRPQHSRVNLKFQTGNDVDGTHMPQQVIGARYLGSTSGFIFLWDPGPGSGNGPGRRVAPHDDVERAAHQRASSRRPAAAMVLPLSSVAEIRFASD